MLTVIARRGFWLIPLVPVVFALLALGLGKEAGWDLQNYHWYNPYAWLSGRLGFDIAVAHVATYYNPLADLAVYWLGSHGPAWWVGAFLGALFGVVVLLIGAVAYQGLQGLPASLRASLAVLVAVAGALGGGAFGSLGSTTNDVPSALGIFLSLWLLLRTPLPDAGAIAHSSSNLRGVAGAGVAAGIAVGFKLTNAVYALGLVAAVPWLCASWRQRAAVLAVLGAGLFAGYAVSGGFWLWRMWEYGRNPFFPYFNHWFHSPLLLNSDYRDTSYVSGNWRDLLLFPWLFTRDSLRASEVSFRDAHVLAAYVLVPLALLMLLWRARVLRVMPDARVIFLLLFGAVSYVAWLVMFSIYRYLIPLEMLAPLLILLALLQLPLGSFTLRTAMALLLLVGLQCVVRLHLERVPWTRDYVSVQAPPVEPDSMVLMAGTAPMAFVIPSFPASVPFLRIDGWLVAQEDASSGLARALHARVAAHRGAFYMLFVSYELQRAQGAARAYGLELHAGQCRPVFSNIAAPLRLCAVRRATGEDEARQAAVVEQHGQR
ncbi:MAG: hypothetical protein QM718_01535 [Steroidobacteraceae bacterium]